MRLIRWIAALSAGLVLGCGDEPKPSGVSIETDVVEQVCRGTIVHAESELARIEAELKLPPTTEPVEIHVLTRLQLGEYCKPGEWLCVKQPPRTIYIGDGLYDHRITRELVRDRLARSPVSSTKPMFFEGVATALTTPMCTPRSSWDPPAANAPLSRTLGTSLRTEELYLAGELLRWLLDTRGPDTVLDFMATLDRYDTPDEVRVAYLERFGSAIDHDLYAHWRPADQPLTPERAGCIGPELERDDSRSRLLLEASFDCDSPRVRNDFADPERVFVEWTLTIDELTAGFHRLDGELPDGVEVTVSACECQVDIGWTNLPPIIGPLTPTALEVDGFTSLDPGVYRVRAYGPIGASLEHEIVTPCDFTKQNCPSGQQCTPSGRCTDQIEDPDRLGDPCWPPDWLSEDPAACEAGLTCVGSYDHSGRCLIYCDDDAGLGCPSELSCGVMRGCTEACDPLAPVCDGGWSCLADFEAGEGGCHPFPITDLGLLEPCSVLEFRCSPGLWCASLDDVDGCHDPDAFIDFSGCCVPICDPSVDDPGCPPELPHCMADVDHALGTCQP